MSENRDVVGAASHGNHVAEIVLVRHGETNENVAERVGRFYASALEQLRSGFLPDHKISLTETGRSQADMIGRVLAKHVPACRDYDIYFDSGYKRTMETLDLILKAFAVDVDAEGKRNSHIDLREREPGYHAVMTVTDVNQYFPWYQEYEARMGKFYASSPGGESVAHVCSRVHMFLNSLRRARVGQKAFVVTHGRVMLAFRYWLEKWAPFEADELFEAEPQNCQVLIYKRVEVAPGSWRFVAQEELEDALNEDFERLCRDEKINTKNRQRPRRRTGAQWNRIWRATEAGATE